MKDAAGLLDQYRAKGILIDANLLVLLLVGTVNRQRIRNFKRTSDFTAEDYDLLLRLINHFGRLIATPHVLSQASDLADLPGKELHVVREKFKLLIEDIDESFEPSKTLVNDSVFARLGLADAAIANICAQGALALTTDFDLWHSLQERGIDALNFNHLRVLAWRR